MRRRDGRSGASARGGPAAARNDGLEHVETEFVAFLDSDCVPPPDWIERLAGHFDDPRVAAVAPRDPGARTAAARRSTWARAAPCRYVPSAALIVRDARRSRGSTRRSGTARTST